MSREHSESDESLKETKYKVLIPAFFVKFEPARLHLKWVSMYVIYDRERDLWSWLWQEADFSSKKPISSLKGRSKMFQQWVRAGHKPLFRLINDNV